MALLALGCARIVRDSFKWISEWRRGRHSEVIPEHEKERRGAPCDAPRLCYVLNPVRCPTDGGLSVGDGRLGNPDDLLSSPDDLGAYPGDPLGDPDDLHAGLGGRL